MLTFQFEREHVGLQAWFGVRAISVTFCAVESVNFVFSFRIHLLFGILFQYYYVI